MDLQRWPRKNGARPWSGAIGLRSKPPKWPHGTQRTPFGRACAVRLADPARHLLSENSVTVMRSPKNAMTSVAGLAASLGRPVLRRALRQSPGSARRGSPVGWRCVAAILALGLGLSGISPCLCAAESAQISDPHACCAHSASPRRSAPTAGTFVTTSANPCCTSPTAAGLAARLDDRDVLRHTFAAGVARATAPDHQVALSTLGVSAASLQHFPPPRTTVLRI